MDVTARIANARRLEERLIDLLATRTGKLQDVLNVERELARVREEIERHEGRLRFLKTRTSLSTLSVSIHEPLPITGNPSAGDVVAEAFRRAWRNLLAVIAGGIASLGVLVPRRAGRRDRRGRGAPVAEAGGRVAARVPSVSASGV